MKIVLTKCRFHLFPYYHDQRNGTEIYKWLWIRAEVKNEKIRSNRAHKG